jgi:hypothetical protein
MVVLPPGAAGIPLWQSKITRAEHAEVNTAGYVMKQHPIGATIITCTHQRRMLVAHIDGD